jgi:ribosomal-protein-alanine N-acetyltransferase
LELSDLAAATALHARSASDAWNEQAIAKVLAMPGAFGMLAWVEGQLAGLVIVLVVGADAEILTLSVLPCFRRRGVARRLLASVISRVCAAGCERLLLEVAEDNEAGRALYRTLGFATIGRRPAYYGRPAGAAAAAIVLALRLPPHDG